MLATLRACSMAASDGLQTMGVFGNPEPRIGRAKWAMMSNILELEAAAIVREPTNSMSSSSSEKVLL